MHSPNACVDSASPFTDSAYPGMRLMDADKCLEGSWFIMFRMRVFFNAGRPDLRFSFSDGRRYTGFAFSDRHGWRGRERDDSVTPWETGRCTTSPRRRST